MIVLSPPETLSYSGPPTTREQELEITRAQVQRVMQTLVGVPIRNEHQDLEVGRVTEAYFDTGGNACVRFELCGDPVVTERTERLIQAGWLRGLSLSHDPSTMRAAEVSLCFRGARPGTVINEWPGSDQIDNAKCKPLSGAPMQAAARSSFVAASAMMSNGSSAPYNPAAQVLVPPHQVGLPAPGQPSANPNVITHNSLAGMPAGPTRTALGAIQPQELGSGLPMPQQQQAQPQQQQQQQTTGAKRRRVTLPNGQEIELTDEEIAQMQQAPQVQASGTAPTAAAPAAAEDDTASKHSDTHEQILHRMVKNGGFLSPEDQEKLISGFARSKRDRTATQAELERHKRESQAELEHYKRKAEAARGSDEAQRQQMIELLPAFIGTFLGTDANKNREDMRQMLSGEGGEARFMREAVPQLVAASAIAMDRFRHQRQQAPIPSHLQRALDALGDAHTDMQSEGLLPQAFPAAAAPPQPVFSSEKLGWQPQPGLVQASGQRGRAEQQQAHDPFAVMRQLSQEIGPVTNNVYRRADVMDRIGSVAEPATPQQLINAGLPRVSMPQRRG